VIKIEISSFVPIYEQIKKEIKSRVSLGILRPREPLPSIRDLAESLLVNPNTVARAYRELELEGIITTRKGKGCYVSDDMSSFMTKKREAILNKIFDEAIAEAKKFSLNPEKMKELFEERLHLSLRPEEDGRE
jgi:GntR family transcriptional regulator